jgi:hypothetical protein
MAPPIIVFARFIIVSFIFNLLDCANGQEDEGQEAFIVGDLSQYTTNGVCHIFWIAFISASETLTSYLLLDFFFPSTSSKTKSFLDVFPSTACRQNRHSHPLFSPRCAQAI